jgi:dolichyl-diphosphooligosaccharide--protein glycosyltransferase
VWTAFQKRNDMSVFALILGLTGVYVSATFARLLVFSSIGIIVLASIGLYEVTRGMLERREAAGAKGKKKVEYASIPSGSVPRMIYVGVIIAMLLVPVLYPPNASWVAATDVPTAMANAGTAFRISTTDWVDAMEWVSENTEEDAVIVSWWDYGYWITTLGQRTTVNDNATLNSTRIQTVARMFMGDEQSGIKIAQDLGADYVLVFIVGQKLFTGTTGVNGTESISIYSLGQGGEESKKQWISRIAGYPDSRFWQVDGITPKDNFWTSTLLGKMTPFEPLSYASIGPTGAADFKDAYQPGLIQIYSKNVKYPADGGADQPFHLAYSSPSFQSDSDIVTGVMIYRVNQDYVPHPTGDPYRPDIGPVSDTTPGSEIGEFQTVQGTFRVEFFPNAAPGHVQNFITLAKSGFYDGTAFHRIAPGFVIQGGDPLTANATIDRSEWGTGGPGYTIPAEFNDIPHSRGILSMARSEDPDSAGSQFFIVLQDANALDGRYTVFGRVIEGMDVVDRIAALPIEGNAGDGPPVNVDDARIISVRILPR